MLRSCEKRLTRGRFVSTVDAGVAGFSQAYDDGGGGTNDSQPGSERVVERNGDAARADMDSRGVRDDPAAES